MRLRSAKMSEIAAAARDGKMLSCWRCCQMRCLMFVCAEPPRPAAKAFFFLLAAIARRRPLSCFAIFSFPFLVIYHTARGDHHPPIH